MSETFEDYFGNDVTEQEQLAYYETRGAGNIDDVAKMLESDYLNIYNCSVIDSETYLIDGETVAKPDFSGIAEHMYEIREWNS